MTRSRLAATACATILLSFLISLGTKAPIAVVVLSAATFSYVVLACGDVFLRLFNASDLPSAASWAMGVSATGFALWALVALLGCSALIALALVIAARINSEEIAGGVLNVCTFPMMMLSGVFFSLESAPKWLQNLANALPLTQILTAARAIMIDGAGFAGVWPELVTLLGMTGVFLAVGAALFRWRFV